MIRTVSFVSVTALLVALAASQPAMARSIKNYLSDSDLASYCASVGVDTETSASVKLQDNTIVSGTIHCEAEDLIVGNDDRNDAADDSDDRLDDSPDDDDDAFDDSDGRGDDDSSDDHDDDHDDDHGSDHGSDDSDDDSGDDHGDDHGGDRDGDDD
jgi:hypothetical protein